MKRQEATGREMPPVSHRQSRDFRVLRALRRPAQPRTARRRFPDL